MPYFSVSVDTPCGHNPSTISPYFPVPSYTSTTSISTHDLTKRSTQIRKFFVFFARNFNSRPHEEVDMILVASCLLYIAISTHDLTKRSTTIAEFTGPRNVFQLTTSRRGRLRFPVFTAPCRIFQLTTSRRGRRFKVNWIDKAEEFQLTTSRRGRQRSL